jgi:hypothetical protein
MGNVEETSSQRNRFPAPDQYDNREYESDELARERQRLQDSPGANLSNVLLGNLAA